jgi:salicylate hydroxylase
VTLSSGEVIHGNLVIAADGIHSIGVETVVGHVNQAVPQEHHNFCYRFLIPAADINADPRTRFWTEDDDGRTKILLGDNQFKRLVSYPCRK